jgi:hypothetical protein
MEEFVKGQPTYLFEQVLSLNSFFSKRKLTTLDLGRWPKKRGKKKKKKKPGVMVI